MRFVGKIPALADAFRHIKSVGAYERDLEIFTSLPGAGCFIARVTGIGRYIVEVCKAYYKMHTETDPLP
jgi:hypothetical protein